MITPTRDILALAVIFLRQMRKERLRDNFEGAVDSLVKLTQELCSNKLSANYRYVLKPNLESVDRHLTETEISFHKRILTFRNKPLDENETLDLLWSDYTVPLWINISVIKSTDRSTTIELMTSRRLRNESDFSHVVDKFPPFHPQVPLPPGHENGKKFDINWTRSE